MMHSRNRQSGQRGVILLETLIAILIFSIGILALVGLQAVMISNTTDAKYRSEASLIAQKRIAVIWGTDPINHGSLNEGDPANPLGSPGMDVSKILPNGIRYTVQVAPGEFLVLVTWQPPGDPLNIETHQHMAVARVMGGA